MYKQCMQNVFNKILWLLLLLSLVMATGAFAAQPTAEIIINIHWTDSEGNPQVTQAQPIMYPGYENAYWLYISEEALQNATVEITDFNGIYKGGFNLQNGTPLLNVLEQGTSQALEDIPVYFQGLDEIGNILKDFSLYVSTFVELPPPPVATPEPQKTQITVRYVDIANNNNLLNPQTVELFPGEQKTVYAENIEGYNVDVQEQTVYVDEAGNPSTPEVIFYYSAIATPEPQKTQITVRYVDITNNNNLLNPQTVELFPGEQQTVYAENIEGYNVDVQEQTIYVDEAGNPSTPEVIFYYSAIATPEPQKVQITIRFVDIANNNNLLNPQTVELFPGEQQTVYAENIEGYNVDVQEQTVYVDEAGNPSTPEVIFYYVAIETPAPQTEEPTEAPTSVNIIVRFIDKDTGAEIASAQEQTLPTNEQTTVYALPSDLKEGYTLVDGVDAVLVQVDALGIANPSSVEFYYIKLNLPTVTVRYLEEGTDIEVAKSQKISLNIGENIINANPENLLDGYEIISPSVYIVTASYDEATTYTVEFYYTKEISTPVDVMVHYLDEKTGSPVASSQKLECKDGTNSITASPQDLKEGYALKEGESDTKYVIVSSGSANPDSIIFYYSSVGVVTDEPTSDPAPKVALVKVYYRDQFGKNIVEDAVSCVENEENIVVADLSKLDSNIYELTGTDRQQVVVDNQGNSTPSEIVFLFKDLSVDRTANILIRYLSDDGKSIAPDQQISVRVGTTIVKNSLQTPDGYKAKEPLEQEITLSKDGTLSSDTVIFYYEALPATDAPSASPFPYSINSMDAYAYPRSDNINFRSEPKVSQDNVISVVGKKDLVHITGSLTNNQDEMWYKVEINGVEGFLRENVTRVLSQAEAESALGYTPKPTDKPTPAPSAIVDGVAINRWANANVGGVNIRSKMTTSSKRVAKLNKGDDIFVFQQQTVDADPWYAVLVDGNEGFVMAKFIDLMSQSDSNKKQSELPSPAPIRTLPPAEQTGVPTLEPTKEPAPTTAPPKETTPPASYLGYALTNREVSLTTGVGNSNELEIARLPQNTIVMVTGQAYVDSRAWNMVDALPIRQSGYLPDDALRRISSQEAAPYLNALQAPVTPATKAPVLSQHAGFGITLGENAPLRANMDTNSQIIYWLPKNEIVQVYGQDMTGGNIWHISRYKENYGFIRNDQLRLLNSEEEKDYIASLRATLPPAATPNIGPSASSLSSYGYVNADKVRLRKDASLDSAHIKMMDKNAFALVIGSKQAPDGKTWYHINQAGTEGYVLGDYFNVLSMSELTRFLQSDAYINANASNEISPGIKTPSNITPVEDFNTQVWTNPSLAQVSYEPFNPLGSPTPNVEEIVTPSPTPTGSPESTVSINPLATELPSDAPTSSFPTGIVVLVIIAVLGAGGYYGYYMYRKNQQRETQRVAKRKRIQSDDPVKPGTSPYAPPRPRTPLGHVPPRPGQQAPPRPGQPIGTQGTAQYKPPTGQPPQGTAQYRPPTGQPQAGAPQGTAQYRPPMGQPPQAGASQGTVQYRPLAGQPSQGTAKEQRSGQTLQSASQKPQIEQTTRVPIKADTTSAKPSQDDTLKPKTDTPPRRRRSDRHENS
ncbi:MAG TPA: hypothetical protein GXZ91_07700 [Christensenellaceae bacterium]|nr:hypothetical protein [Christensenellaceae bacterium]